MVCGAGGEAGGNGGWADVVVAGGGGGGWVRSRTLRNASFRRPTKSTREPSRPNLVWLELARKISPL